MAQSWKWKSNTVLRTTAKMIHELLRNMPKVIQILRARRVVRLHPERYDLNRSLVNLISVSVHAASSRFFNKHFFLTSLKPWPDYRISQLYNNTYHILTNTLPLSNVRRFGSTNVRHTQRCTQWKQKKPRARLKNAGLTSNLQFQNDPHDYSPHAARAADTTSHNLIRLNPRTCMGIRRSPIRCAKLRCGTFGRLEQRNQRAWNEQCTPEDG